MHSAIWGTASRMFHSDQPVCAFGIGVVDDGTLAIHNLEAGRLPVGLMSTATARAGIASLDLGKEEILAAEGSESRALGPSQVVFIIPFS